MDRFYEDLDSRIGNHNVGKYGGKSYTSQASDWEPSLSFVCDDYSHAVRLERKIKSMKSRTYIENLLRYPELREKIFLQTRRS